MQQPDMPRLSDLIITNPQVKTFNDLQEIVAQAAAKGIMFLEMDVKPDFVDTPRNWAWKLEGVFHRGKV